MRISILLIAFLMTFAFMAVPHASASETWTLTLSWGGDPDNPSDYGVMDGKNIGEIENGGRFEVTVINKHSSLSIDVWVESEYLDWPLTYIDSLVPPGESSELDATSSYDDDLILYVRCFTWDTSITSLSVEYSVKIWDASGNLVSEEDAFSFTCCCTSIIPVVIIPTTGLIVMTAIKRE